MTDTTTVRARPEQIWQELGEESVILDVDAGVYYGLNSVASRVWRLIQTPRTVAELRSRLVAEYDVEPERASRDLEALLAALETRRLIETAGSSR